MLKKIDLIEKKIMLNAQFAIQRYIILVHLRKFKIGHNFDPTTCQKIGPRTTSPCNTKIFFLEYSFHINFQESQEISAKLNDSIRYSKNSENP